MQTTKNTCQIVMAALLGTVASGCALKMAANVERAAVDMRSENVEATSAVAETQEPSPVFRNAVGPASSLVVHIDPLTGQILPKPPLSSLEQVPEPQHFRSAPIAAPQAVEVPSPVPGGGVKVNLHRQFHRPLFATIDSEGNIQFGHRPAPSEVGVK